MHFESRPSVDLGDVASRWKQTLRRFAEASSLFALAMTISGCVTTGADGVGLLREHVTVVSGERVIVRRAWSLEPDCSTRQAPTLFVADKPAHGELSVGHEKIFPNAGGYYAKCHTHKVMGGVGYYRSDKGYVGKDHAKLRQSHPNGEVVDVDIVINVVKRP